MDFMARLHTVVGDCLFLTEPEEALMLAPDLALDLPPFVSIPVRGGEEFQGSPAVFAGDLREPLVAFMTESLERRGSDGIREDPRCFTADGLREDPLVCCVTGLLVEAGSYSRRLTSRVLLEVVRQSAALLSGDMSEFGAGVRHSLLALRELGGAERGRILADLVWGLTGRLSVAWSLAGEEVPTIRPSRLYQSLVGNRLVFAFEHGTLDPERDLPLVSTLLGIDIDPGILRNLEIAVHTAIEAAVSGVKGDISSTIRVLAGGSRDVRALALERTVSTLAIHGLAELVDVRMLTKRGIPRREAK